MNGLDWVFYPWQSLLGQGYAQQAAKALEKDGKWVYGGCVYEAG